jgi:hypothetical protein
MHAAFDRHRRLTYVAVSIAAAVTFAILAIPLLLGLRYSAGDLLRVDVAEICAFQRQVERGFAPWLSPEIGMGAPLFFSPESQLAYPLRWPFLALPPDLGASLYAIVHLAIAAGGAAHLARTFRVRPLGAVTAGIAFSFSGAALDLLIHTGYFVAAAAWLPIAWGSIRRALSIRRRPAHALLAGASLAACLLAGDPQAFAIGVCVFLAESLRGRRKLRRALALLPAVAGAAAIGLGLWSSIGAELALSRRSGATAVAEALLWSLTPDMWPGVFWPGVLLDLASPGVELRQAAFGTLGVLYPWNPTPYLGLVFVAALPAGILVRRARTASIVFTVGLLFTLGRVVPIVPIAMKLLPFLAVFRYPQKYLVVTTLAGIIVCAVGFEEAASRRRARRALRASTAIVLALEVLAMAVVAAKRGAIDQSALALLERTAYADLPSLSEILLRAMVLALVPLALALLLSLVRGASKARLRALALLLAFDYLEAFPEHIELTPPLAETTAPLAAAAKPGADRVCIEPRAEIFTPGGERWSRASRHEHLRLNLARDLQACEGLASPLGYSPLVSRVNEALRLGPSSEAKARALGCTLYVASDRPNDASTPALEIPRYPRTGGPEPRRIAHPLPPAFVAKGARLFASEDEMIRAIYASASLEETLRIADDPLGRAKREALPAGEGVEIAAFDHPAPDRAQIVLRGTGGAVAGFETSFQTGWHAWQEDRESELPIVRIAGTHLAAITDDASRPIVFEYRPPGFLRGIVCFVTGVFLVIGTALRRSGRSATPPSAHG